MQISTVFFIAYTKKSEKRFTSSLALLFKYLLAFSDEERKYVRVLPDGQEKEECWNKYMFLDKDKYGNEISVLGYGCMRFTQKAGKIDIEKAEKEQKKKKRKYMYCLEKKLYYIFKKIW